MDSYRLENILLKNVCEVYFYEKTDRSFRRMFATKSYKLLDSPIGHAKLGFRRPTGYPSYNPHEYHNVIVWDIEKRDFRTISADTAKVTSIIPDMKYKEMLENSEEIPNVKNLKKTRRRR